MYLSHNRKINAKRVAYGHQTLKKEFNASGYNAPKKKKTSGTEYPDNQLGRPEAMHL
jgi:hypothetical protein